MNDLISEKVIEDILSADKSILSELLAVNPAGLSQIARQKSLKSGKLDLLFLYENELILIELKANEFRREAIEQLNGYYDDLCELQKSHKLIDTAIKKVLLVIGAKPVDFELCARLDITLLVYRPDHVLSRYYENFKELSYFLKLKSGDYGVVRLGLIKPILRALSQGRSIKEICNLEKKAEKTVRNRLSVAILLGLAAKFNYQYYLTDFGNVLMETGEGEAEDRFNDTQIEVLANFVSENPFYSSITYTIYAILESAFNLAKSHYPVSFENLQDYFVKSVGKIDTWKMQKARETATYIFSNYACELGFLAKVGNNFYITPKGVRSILLLQLNRSLKLIEAQQ